MASDVKVPFGQNFGGMCGSSPDGIWLRALRSAFSEPKPKSLQVSEPNREQGSELGVCFFRRTDFSTPTSALPMKLFLWAEPRPTWLIFHAVNPLA